MTLTEMLAVAKALDMDPAKTELGDLLGKLGFEPTSAAPAEETARPPAQSPPAPDPKNADPVTASADALARATTASAERTSKMVDDRVAFEARERRKLVGELVKLGAEIPATAWGDHKGTVPCQRLQDEPLDDLRERVALLSKNPARS